MFHKLNLFVAFLAIVLTLARLVQARDRGGGQRGSTTKRVQLWPPVKRHHLDTDG